jgi:hypothetical protein
MRYCRWFIERHTSSCDRYRHLYLSSLPWKTGEDWQKTGMIACSFHSSTAVRETHVDPPGQLPRHSHRKLQLTGCDFLFFTLSGRPCNFYHSTASTSSPIHHTEYRSLAPTLSCVDVPSFWYLLLPSLPSPSRPRTANFGAPKRPSTRSVAVA